MADNDLPKIISDEEFDARLRAREQQARHVTDAWENSGIRPPEKRSDGLPPCTLEQRFPRVAQKITLLWRSDACLEYIKSLLVNDRDTRQGFPEDVVADLLMLYQMNERLLRKVTLGPEPVLRRYNASEHQKR